MQRALLYLLVAASYLLLAGGPAWTLGPLLALALAAALVAPRDTFAPRAASRAVDLALLATAGTVAVTLVPLPPALVARLSPHAGDLGRTLALVPATGWFPISVAPRSTALALGTVILAALAYGVARAVFDREGGVRGFCRLLAAGMVAASLGAVVQRAVAPALVMGLIPADAAGAQPIGPFVNRNHFAAWLLLAVPVVAGYIVAHLRHQTGRQADGRPRAAPRTVALVAAVSVATGTLLWTLSRSAALGLGVAAATWWLIVRARLARDRQGWPLMVGAAGMALLAVAVLVDLDGWWARLASTLAPGPRPDDRLVIWRETLPVLGDFWLTGSGAGTYGTVMIAYQESRIWVPHLASWAHFNQAHNHYLQMAAEGGVLVGVPVLVALGALIAAARRTLARDHSEMVWVRAGAAASLAGVAAQSLWEVPLVMPANAVLAATLAGVLLHEPGRRGRAKGLADSARP